EVFSGFGYHKEAIVALADALKLDADDFNLVLNYVSALHQADRFDDALAQLDVAQKLVTNAEEGEQVLQARIKVFQSTDSLNDRAESLAKELAAGTRATA